MVTFTFQISDEAVDLLKKINTELAEYRDTEFFTLDEFKQSEVFISGSRTEEWFLKRNFGGTYHLIDELSKYNLIECDGVSWHLTYNTTDFGKEVLKQI